MGYDMYHVKEVEEDNYFRLNIWGMGQYYDLMFDYGMVDVTGDHPPFPTPGDIDWDLYDKDEESYPEFRAANEAVLTARGNGKGIASWKFGSNDGWIVSPEECMEALDAYLEAGQPDPFEDRERLDYWHRWIKFLTAAITRDGFQVY